MAWCHQAPSHYLGWCWWRSMSPYGVTWPQWVKYIYERGPWTECWKGENWVAMPSNKIYVEWFPCVEFMLMWLGRCQKIYHADLLLELFPRTMNYCNTQNIMPIGRRPVGWSEELPSFAEVCQVKHCSPDAKLTWSDIVLKLLSLTLRKSFL